jgi:hypothetical protein
MSNLTHRLFYDVKMYVRFSLQLGVQGKHHLGNAHGHRVGRVFAARGAELMTQTG